MNEVMKCLTERRCVRKFKAEQVKKSELDEVIRAGMFAPSGMNRQSAVMLVIQDKDVISKLSKLNAEVMGASADPFFGAPTVIVVLADKNVRTYVEDGSLVMGNMMNAAYSLGLDSCWVHRAREVMNSEYGRELIKAAGFGEEYEGIGNLVLGYRDCDKPDVRERRDGRVAYI